MDIKAKAKKLLDSGEDLCCICRFKTHCEEQCIFSVGPSEDWEKRYDEMIDFITRKEA